VVACDGDIRGAPRFCGVELRVLEVAPDGFKPCAARYQLAISIETKNHRMIEMGSKSVRASLCDQSNPATLAKVLR
jgi:hypothetical protein